MRKPRTSISDVVKEFFRTYSKDKKHSPGTIAGYSSTLNRLAKLMEEDLRRTPFTTDLSLDYMREFLSPYENQAKGTSNKELTKLRTFNRWMIRAGYTDMDHTEEIRPYEGVTRVTPIQHVKEHERDKAAIAGRERIHPSMFYIIHFLFRSGRRVSELRTMRVKDLRFESFEKSKHGKYYFIEHKKQGRVQDMPLDWTSREYLLQWLEEYLSIAKKEGLLPKTATEVPKDWYLFPRWETKARILNPFRVLSTMHVMIGEALDMVGAKMPGNAAHGLRRGGGDKVAQTLGITAAKTLFRHSTEAMTQRYLDRDREKDDLAEGLETLWGNPSEQAVVTPQEPVVAVQREEPQAEIISFAERRARKMSS